ncbi:hypothetical protein chiPu_0033554, partial [Chiloscyllium punctatum]|nr:hypothetical protein [Chiloscyllium punctatum]
MLITGLSVAAGLAAAAWLSRWLMVRQAPEPGPSMRGRTVIVTGANSGLGRATAAALARLHARVIMACRDEKAGAQAARQILQEIGPGGGGELLVRPLDLSSLRSVRGFCDRVTQ